jgi:CheY-like chemotaxis protein
VSAPSNNRGRVLVIDDDAMIRTVLRRTLEPEHEVVACANGQAGLTQLLADQRFDVVFCDLVMPGMNGPEVYRELEARVPAILPRVVLVTGGAFTPELHEFLASVGNTRIEKPFDVNEIRALVAKYVALRIGPPPA